jgi:hypothetical protein
MKSLLAFIAGIVTGVVGVLYYETLAKPALPTEPVLDLDEVGAWELDEWTRLVSE